MEIYLSISEIGWYCASVSVSETDGNISISEIGWYCASVSVRETDGSNMPYQWDGGCCKCQ